MKKRGVALLMAAVFAVANLSGCGRNAGGDGTLGEKEKVRLMVWSPSEDQSKESGEWLQSTCEKFAEEHPEWDITFVYGVADEATALTLTDSAETGATTVSELAAYAVLETSVLLIEATTTVALVASLCTAEESLVVCETSVVAMADEATSAFAVALSKETTPAMATAAVIASVFHCFPLLYNL